MRRFRELVCLLLAVAPAWAQRGYPRIETVFPGAVTRGTSTEVLLTGRYNLREATRVIFDRPGVTATVIDWQDLSDPAANKGKPAQFEREGLRIKVVAVPEIAPGIYPFRILTKGSLSALAHLLVTAAPSINETEPNNSREKAQAIQVPQTVNGRLDEVADADFYRFEAKAGESIAFIVHAARLQRPVPQLERDFSDIVLSLQDANGAELASADDSLTEDPEMSYKFERAGVYYLYLREARYHSGKNKWWYALSARKDPVVTSVFPPVARPGQKVKLELSGFNVAGLGPYEIQVPAAARDQFEFNVASNPVVLGVSELAEIESPAAGPKTISIPAGINGRIASDGEVDRYRFTARAGDRLEFEIQARRWGSSLDALLEIHDVSGRLLEAQDDMINIVGQTADGLSFPVDKDPRIAWTAPDDGQYEIQVRDANYFGGPRYHYYFIARRQAADFALVVDDDRLPVGPGESVTAVVTVDRRNGFKGPVELFVRGLPEGVSSHRSIIPPHLDQGNIVITASPGSKPDARAIIVGGRATAGGVEMERIAKPYAPMGQAGGRSFLAVPSAVAAVTEGSDIILEAEPKAVTLRRGESATVKIHVTRNNYSGPVEMNVILWNLMQRFSKLPSGLTYEEKQSKTSMGTNETEGYVTFRAQPDAPPLDDYLMAVMGQITYNRIFMTRVAAPFRLSIR